MMKKLEASMAKPLVDLPMTRPARVISKSGWTLKPYVPGQAGQLTNG